MNSLSINEKVADVLIHNPDPALVASNEQLRQAVQDFRDLLTDDQDEAYLMLERIYSDNFDLSARLLYLAGINDSDK